MATPAAGRCVCKGTPYRSCFWLSGLILLLDQMLLPNGKLEPWKAMQITIIVVHVAAGCMRRWPLMDILGPCSDFMGQRTSAEVIRKWNARATRLGREERNLGSLSLEFKGTFTENPWHLRKKSDFQFPHILWSEKELYLPRQILALSQCFLPLKGQATGIYRV